MHLNAHTHIHSRTNAHIGAHKQKASPDRGVEILVSLEMPVETLSSPFTHTHTHSRRAGLTNGCVETY